MTKKKEIELARKFFDLIFREVENGEDVIYDFIDPECRYKALCDKLNNETVKEVLELGFKQKYGEEWHGGKGEQDNVDTLYDAKAVGNAAAMREEVAGIRNTANSALTALSLGNDSSSFLWDIIRKCKAAVAKPPRNCDLPLVVDGPVNSNADKAWLVFKRHNPDAHFSVSGLLRCIDWLLATATKQKRRQR